MAIQLVERDRDYLLNHCTKYLARDYSLAPRHTRGVDPGISSFVAEAWRFPIVDTYSGMQGNGTPHDLNEVTFVYFDPRLPSTPSRVEILGTFSSLHEPISLRRIGDLPYFAVTAIVPAGELHTYKYLVNGRPELDPINPQRTRLDNGAEWSRFFTHHCTVPASLERWEREILKRFTSHILPFHTRDGQRFLDQYASRLDRESADTTYPNAYRLDASVGVVNFIDKLLAREESHHLVDYKICLEIIDGVLRLREPHCDPIQMQRGAYIRLYNEMAEYPQSNVPEWDKSRYENPRYFLELMRRHTLTGAFSHPKYGGNAAGAGWAYLEDRYQDKDGKTLFDWRKHQEKPLGRSSEYRG